MQLNERIVEYHQELTELRRDIHRHPELAFEEREVTLASGKKSNFYIDTKQVSLKAEGHFLVGQLFRGLVEVIAPEAEASRTSLVVMAPTPERMISTLTCTGVSTFLTPRTPLLLSSQVVVFRSPGGVTTLTRLLLTDTMIASLSWKKTRSGWRKPRPLMSTV